MKNLKRSRNCLVLMHTHFFVLIDKLLPTSYFCRCHVSNNFRHEPVSKFCLQSYQWFSYIARLCQINTSKLCSTLVRSHKHLKPLLVHGFSQETIVNTVFEYFGFFFILVTCVTVIVTQNGSHVEIHPLKKSTPWRYSAKNIGEKTGFDFWVTRWSNYRMSALQDGWNPEMAAFIEQNYNLFNCKTKECCSFFGFVQVDISTPGEL